ncbi:MAG: DUF305 domain-containing protein [Microbacterium sp.]|uniref:DUF305 domain-containing protein n=1 Tax=unclassified Microbacterium TaxID=2609290 RepID=UPI000C5D1F02|nr:MULTISPECIES: DUF305 domain-containing protein [unclassified Microbacterium]MAY49969.1 DUF305 domain-containing protein [Microbacterium sp.]HAS31319.1 DUF305 domain-containing protein [Microbacterium sp.]HBR89600.1 DUF305 domain-containing protein [Microbacterium sp.]HBS73186.1 DUF305 domain-containing protein [Microbacterium sp.]|tara:strand:- start:1095 stop:1673 length:579 start_codon:yes stop_codon:yes gene_type:complete
MKRRSVRWMGALAVASTLAVTGCTAGTTVTAPTPTQSAETFTSADVMFAMMMIPHHEQAVAMSDVLLGKDSIDTRVRELAEGIRAAQQPEIELMESWLDEWGMDEFGDMGRMTPGAGMMMSEMDMSALEDASGADAERVFLEEMIVHHEGAIQMSRALLEAGSNPDARVLAEEIIVDQTDEITLMRDLLTDY